MLNMYYQPPISVHQNLKLNTVTTRKVAKKIVPLFKNINRKCNIYFSKLQISK